MTMRTLITAVAIVLALLAGAAPVEEEGVMVLDEQSFGDAIKSNQYILVMFYAPWCGHCKQFRPEFERAARHMKGAKPPVLLAKVDATVETKIAEEYGVRGYPTIKLFIDGREQEYTGGRTDKSIITWLAKKTGPPAVPIEDAAAMDAFEKEHSSFVLGLFSEGQQRASFETVSRQLEDMVFAYSTSSSVAAKYGLTPPALRMVFPHDEKVADFSGDLNSVAEIETFVKARRYPIVSVFTGENAADLFHDGRAMLFLFRNQTSEDAEKAVREAAISLDRKVLVVLVGDSEPMDQRLMDYVSVDPDELPTVRLVVNPTATMTKYKMVGPITPGAVTNFVSDWTEGKLQPHLKSDKVPDSQPGPVYVLVGSTFNSVVMDTSRDVLVMFYAPWCGHCKKLEPVYRDVAKRVENIATLTIAKIDTTANDVEGVDVEGFPTIKFWRADKKGDPIDYDGDRDVDSFVQWLETKVSIPFTLADVRSEL